MAGIRKGPKRKVGFLTQKQRQKNLAKMMMKTKQGLGKLKKY